MEGSVKLFNRSKKPQVIGSYFGEPIKSEQPQLDYDSVLEWLVGLSVEDYRKVVRTTDIHRNAYVDTCKILGEEPTPITFINPPEPEANMLVVDKNVNHLDHKLSMSLLEDDTDSIASRKQRITAKKAVRAKSK